MDRGLSGEMIVIADDQARVEVHPEMGGALGRYVVQIGHSTAEIFKTGESDDRPPPFSLGCNVLVPFSNRISGGGFRHGGRFWPLPTPPGQKFPIHGNGLSSAWSVKDVARSRATLELHSDGPGPFRYIAALTYSLEAGALTMRLEVRNVGPDGLPFGVGFHPWFPREEQTRVTFRTTGYWTEDEDHLPGLLRRTSEGGGFDFTGGARLPDDWINNAFVGWDGMARIGWPERGIGVEMVASRPLRTVIVYSPSQAADYFCLEPVSHSVDAHNRSDPGTAPPQVLGPGESLVAEVTLAPFQTATGGKA